MKRDRLQRFQLGVEQLDVVIVKSRKRLKESLIWIWIFFEKKNHSVVLEIRQLSVAKPMIFIHSIENYHQTILCFLSKVSGRVMSWIRTRLYSIERNQVLINKVIDHRLFSFNVFVVAILLHLNHLLIVNRVP